MDTYVDLATQSIDAYIRHARVIAPPPGLPEALGRRAGVFVSLKKNARLRGCIGTFLPTRATVAHEIIENAIKAATADPRFPPIREEELEDLRISVDVLGEPETCSEAELDPKRYGIIVESGSRRGLLLPDLDGVATAESQLEIVRAKAGIRPDETAALRRFTVERHT